VKDSKGFSNSIGGSAGASGIGSSSIGEGDGGREKIDPNRGAGTANYLTDFGAPNAVLTAGKPSVVNSGPSKRPPVRYPGQGAYGKSPGPIRTPSAGGKPSDPLR
jgi:hypothetical protein